MFNFRSISSTSTILKTQDEDEGEVIEEKENVQQKKKEKIQKYMEKMEKKEKKRYAKNATFGGQVFGKFSYKYCI